jgi:uncharacterized protein YggT (Ycf19 family)
MGMSYLVLAGAIMLASWLVSSRLKANLSTILMQLQNGMSGAERKMLADNGILDVRHFGIRTIDRSL